MQAKPNRPSRQRVERGIVKRTTADGRIVFEIEYRDSTGRQRRRAVAGGIKAARVALADVKARMGRGERVSPQPRLTFAQAAERYMESATATLRPRTVEAYGAQLRTHLLPRWAGRRLDSLAVDDVARLVEEMRAEGKRAWTIRGALVVAGRVFEHARRRLGHAGENPVRSLERSERPASDQRDRRILDHDELSRLLAAADERHRPAFAFAAHTGGRLGEVLALRYGDLDLREGTVTFARQLDRTGALVEPKTRRARRTVELPTALVVELRERRLREGASADTFLFCNRVGRPFDRRNLTRQLAAAAERAGLTPAPTFHDLRHSHASAWIAAGGDLVELSARLGHGNPAITASVYSHEFEVARRSEERTARLDAIYGSTVAAPDRSEAQQSGPPTGAEVTDLQARRELAQ